MSINYIRPAKIEEKKRSLVNRLIDMTVFTIKERLMKSRLFLLLFLIYTFMVATGTAIIVVFSDFFVRLIIRAGLDIPSVYYGLIIFGFTITTLNDLVFWIIAFSGANLISDELKSRSMILYYSKPIPRFFYIVSRFLAIFSIIFIVAIIPLMIMVSVPLIRHQDIMVGFNAFDVLAIVLETILSSVTIISFYILFVFAITMIVEDRGASVLVAFITYYSSYILGFSLSRFVDPSFQIISILFWVTSFLLVMLGIPWKNLDKNVLDMISSFLFLPDLDLDPSLYVYGAIMLMLALIAAVTIVVSRIKNVKTEITGE